MTIEELDALKNETVYLEYRYPSYSSGYRKTSWIRAWLGSTKSPNRALYGITWRCWDTQPGAEELMAAEWKEDSNATD
jgi:hypothetical protein